MPEQKKIYSRQEISSLCARATHVDDALSKPAVQELFGGIVEGLCDSFLARSIARYDRVFTQVIDHCRRLPDGNELDLLLKRFGLCDERAMLARKKTVQQCHRFPVAGRRKIKKICVLSRVTVGADVAVTGVVLSKIRKVFPGVSIVIIGPQKLAEVFGGQPDIRIQDVPYVRRGGLLGRLNAWVGLVGVIDAEKQNLRLDEFLVIDPDSRLTQLGLLPVVEKDKGYFFFQSRTYAKARSGRIGELTANWLDDVFGAEDEKTYSEIFIDHGVMAMGRMCVSKLSYTGKRRVVSINFGVGGNEKKRVSAGFEEDLVRAVLKQGAAVILDKGFGAEVGQMNELVSRLRLNGVAVLEVGQHNISEVLQYAAWDCDVLTWEGGINVFGALIAGSDAYIGYDSGFQHIASALGIPIVDVFKGAPSALFVKRWTPYGTSSVDIIKEARGKDRVKAVSRTVDRVVVVLKKLFLT